ncbi:MAG: hypothetical protein KDC39_09820 [Actinobacteria bacterium]|nr:hypothetical protein [Actinomycetota bacterium]
MACYRGNEPGELVDLAKESSDAADRVRQARTVFGRLPDGRLTGRTAREIGKRWKLINKRLVKMAEEYEQQAAVLRRMSDWVAGRIETIGNARRACEQEEQRLSGELEASYRASQATQEVPALDPGTAIWKRSQLAGLAVQQAGLRAQVSALSPGWAALDLQWEDLAASRGLAFVKVK